MWSSLSGLILLPVLQPPQRDTVPSWPPNRTLPRSASGSLLHLSQAALQAGDGGEPRSHQSTRQVDESCWQGSPSRCFTRCAPSHQLRALGSASWSWRLSTQEQNCPRCLPSFTPLRSYVELPGWKQGELCAEQALPGLRGFLSRGLAWSFP